MSDTTPSPLVRIAGHTIAFDDILYVTVPASDYMRWKFSIYTQKAGTAEPVQMDVCNPTEAGCHATHDEVVAGWARWVIFKTANAKPQEEA